MIGQRIKQLRLARGLTLDALAEQAGGIVTRQSLSKYETGKATPSPAVVTKVAEALGVKSARLWAPPSINVEFIAYRRKSGLRVRDDVQIKSLVCKSLEERVRLQDLLGGYEQLDLPFQGIKVSSIDESEIAAEQLRKQFNLGLDPISSMTDVLEDHSVHVMEIEVTDQFDGVSAVATDPSNKKVVAAVVVTQGGQPGERQRLNLAHELGHLVMDLDGGVDAEEAAFRFGAAFLAPSQELYKEVGKKRTSITLNEMLALKRRYGLSVQALIRRFKELGIISDSYYSWYYLQMSKNGMRRHEPEEIPREESQWLMRNVLRAHAEGLIRADEANDILGEDVVDDESVAGSWRRDIMRLPLSERRSLLFQQANDEIALQDAGSEAEDLETGDFIEY